MNSRFALAALSVLGGAVTLLATPSRAAAHVCLDYPVSRVGAECTARSPQKMGPCPVPRGENVTVFRPGETIRVKIRETINHPSHYRVAFSPSGEDFRDPVSVDDTNNDYPYILVDGVEDAEDAIQEIEITFPNEPTETGVLQVIQVMYDKGGNGFGGNSGGPTSNDDLYYACADIALRVGGGPAASAGSSSEGVSRAALALPVAALLLGAGFVRRDRKRRNDA
jgi:hypothetical protein